MPADDPESPVGPLGRQVWHALGERAEDLGRIAPPELLPGLPSPMPVGRLAHDAVAVASLAADLVLDDRTPSTVTPRELPRVAVDPFRVRTSFRSERVLEVDGRRPDVWSERSGFFQAADGWVRVHGNYPHHADRACRILGLPTNASTDAYRKAIRGRPAQDLEDAAVESAAVVVRVRDAEEWRDHPQGSAAARAPIVTVGHRDEGDRRGWSERASSPLSGVRVLDLCRVIAGPVGTRLLAQAGADVLRVDSPWLPEPAWQHLDTGQGKRSTLLDLADARDRRSLDDLLGAADVVVTGYRPGALDRYGLSPAELVERHPGVVVGTIAAWDPSGPWAGRRGFDSIVQAVSGIAQVHTVDGTPGALPAQALDHSSGYVLAAAVMSALRRQRRSGGTHHVEVTLDRVASRLLEDRTADGGAGAGLEPGDSWPVDSGVVDGVPVRCAPPAAAFAGATESWPAMARPHGEDRPVWLTAT